MATAQHLANTMAKNAIKHRNLLRSAAHRVSRFLVGGGILFVLSACLFCPVTRTALATHVLPHINDFILGLNISFTLASHVVFFCLMVIGLRIKSKYQD